MHKSQQEKREKLHQKYESEYTLTWLELVVVDSEAWSVIVSESVT